MIRTPNQVYMQNLSQIGEPACPQIFDLAPFLRSIALKEPYVVVIVRGLHIFALTSMLRFSSIVGYNRRILEDGVHKG